MEYLLIATQNNAIRFNIIKRRRDKMQQNSKCWLYGNRDKMINHMISECRKLARKTCKSRHDGVRKMIHWESCKKIKFVHTNKWYTPNIESALENETHKLQFDSEIQTDHRFSARRPDLVIVNNEKKEPAEW